MKLKALDQIHISSVQADTLRTGQEFTVGDDLGAQLMKLHPKTFALVDGPAAGKKAAAERAVGAGQKGEPERKGAASGKDPKSEAGEKGEAKPKK